MTTEVQSKTGKAVLRSRYVMANGVRTHYTEVGDNGPVIIAIHGGGAGSGGNAGMGGLLPELASNFRVIAIDSIGGFGDTDPSAPVPYGVQSRVDHLEDFVDALCLDKFIIMGNSQGAWVAAKYAILHPDRVTKMVLIATATIGAAMGIPEEPTPALKVLLGYDYTREGMKKMLEALAVNHDKVTDELIEARYAASMRPGAKEGMAAHAAGHRYLQSEVMRPNFDMTTTLPAITKHIPTIFIWGNDDQMAPVALGHKLQPMLPDVKWHFIDDAGHQVQTDQPEKLGQIITEFAKS